MGDDKSSSSLALRSKKFLASKAVHTKAGRKAITHFLGDDGHQFLLNIKWAARKDVGHDRAKEVKQILFKMVIKVKLLSDSKKIKKKDVWQLMEPVNTAALQFYNCLKPLPPSDEKESKEEKPGVDLQPLLQSVAVLKEMCVALMKGHIKEKNLKSMIWLFDYLGGDHFLSLLINSPDFSKEKSVVFSTTRRLLKPLLETRSFNDAMVQLCKCDGCEDFSLVRAGDFPGSRYCAAHHIEAYKHFVAAPNVHHFLFGDGVEYFPFQELCKKEVERFARKLYLATVNYRNSKAGVRPVFAEEIFSRYLKPKATCYVPIPGEMVTRVIEQKASKDQELFAEIETHLFQRIETFFKQVFLASDAFRAYRDITFKLPDYMLEFEEDTKD